jgi:hypothetical protein
MTRPSLGPAVFLALLACAARTVYGATYALPSNQSFTKIAICAPLSVLILPTPAKANASSPYTIVGSDYGAVIEAEDSVVKSLAFEVLADGWLSISTTKSFSTEQPVKLQASPPPPCCVLPIARGPAPNALAPPPPPGGAAGLGTGGSRSRLGPRRHRDWCAAAATGSEGAARCERRPPRRARLPCAVG